MDLAERSSSSRKGFNEVVCTGLTSGAVDELIEAGKSLDMRLDGIL